MNEKYLNDEDVVQFKISSKFGINGEILLPLCLVEDLKEHTFSNNMSLKDFITLYYKNENVDIDDFNYDMLIDYSYKFEKLNEIFGAYK